MPKPKSMVKTTSIRFDAECLAALEASAKAKGMHVSAVIRSALDGYFLRERLADELGDMEGRLAAGITRSQRETARANDDIQLLIAFVDQLAQFVFFTTPEIVDKTSAEATGVRRHQAFIASMKDAFQHGRKRAVFADAVERPDSVNGIEADKTSPGAE